MASSGFNDKLCAQGSDISADDNQSSQEVLFQAYFWEVMLRSSGLSGQDQAAVVLHTDHFPRLLFFFFCIFIL